MNSRNECAYSGMISEFAFVESDWFRFRDGTEEFRVFSTENTEEELQSIVSFEFGPESYDVITFFEDLCMKYPKMYFWLIVDILDVNVDENFGHNHIVEYYDNNNGNLALTRTEYSTI